MNTTYDLYHPFDFDKHKKNFFHYFEAIILPNGVVEYAVPSHQEKLIKIGMQKHHMTNRRDYEELCPREYWCDYLAWLLQDTDCIACWTDHWMGTPNRFQKHTIKRLLQEQIIEQ